MQTNTLSFEKFTRTNKPSLSADTARKCKKTLHQQRKLARQNKRFTFEGDL